MRRIIITPRGLAKVMSKTLSQLLGNRQISTDGFVRVAEELSGYPSEDIRLMSDLATNSRSILSHLNLDPTDTTAGELYHALLVEYDKASNSFSRQIGETPTDSTLRRLKRVAQIVAHGQTNRQIWALKKTAARRLLKDHQPKKLMKELNYRSLDSMLKRENISLIYAALPYVESLRWLKLMQKAYASLSSNDFETKETELVIASGKRWANVAQKPGATSGVNELGAIIFWPNPQSGRITSLGLSILGLGVADKLQCNLAWLKLHQFHPSFSKHLAGSITSNAEPYIKITYNQLVAWSAVQRAFAGRSNNAFPQSFEPYLERADLSHKTPTQLLIELIPAMHNWAKYEYLVFSDANGKLVSCNLEDVVINSVKANPLHKHVRSAGMIMLEEKLVKQYLLHKGFESYVLATIENSGPANSGSVAKSINFNKLGTAISHRMEAI